MFSKTILAASAALLTIAGGAPADAQLTRIVRYRDLDLASTAGAKAFAHRLQRAVDFVCRRPDATHPLTGFEDQDCRAEVAARLQPRMQGAIQLAQARAATEIAAR